MNKTILKDLLLRTAIIVVSFISGAFLLGFILNWINFIKTN